MAALMVCALQSAEPWSAVFTPPPFPTVPHNQGRKGDWSYLVLYLHLLEWQILDVKSVHLTLTPSRGGHVGGHTNMRAKALCPL